jgi:hypothetical protein
MAKARVRFDEHRFDEARGLVRRLLALEPENWEGPSLLSRIEKAELMTRHAAVREAAQVRSRRTTLGIVWVVFIVLIAVGLYFANR